MSLKLREQISEKLFFFSKQYSKKGWIIKKQNKKIKNGWLAKINKNIKERRDKNNNKKE